mmetsp:Transcript_20921/g.31704  ORF Transcript_20921/g.31704 Transcript_20921/m.31704 type:complete len:442 (+) Transcript_20921:106-1431(+)
MKSLIQNHTTMIRFIFLLSCLVLAVMMIIGSNNNENDDKNNVVHRTLTETTATTPTINPLDYRIATFGSSRTKGVHVPIDQTFAGLLKAHNFAIRASGPEYPAMCTYSIIEPYGKFDVVILEFSRESKENKDGALFILAARFRQHFPHVTIIFLHSWAPRQIYHVPTGQSLGQWAASAELSSGGSIYESINAKMQDTPWYDWRIVEPDVYATLAQTTADGVGGHVLRMPINRDDVRESMANYSHFFLDDYIHLSTEGHQWVRNGIVDILQKTKAKRSNYTRPWYSTDACQSWYATGKMTRKQATNNMQMVEFQEGKFGLEIQKGAEGTLQVTNPGRKPVNLFISYMVTAPEQRYPKTRIWLTYGSNNRISSSQEITPVWQSSASQVAGLKLHVVSHARIGKLEVGNSTLHIAPKEETEYPFRLVGIMVTPYNFGDTLTALL